MTTYFVTFGGLLIDYYLEVMAQDEKIVRAWIERRSGLKDCFSRVLTERPTFAKPLKTKAEELYYSHADHI